MGSHGLANFAYIGWWANLLHQSKKPNHEYQSQPQQCFQVSHSQRAIQFEEIGVVTMGSISYLWFGGANFDEDRTQIAVEAPLEWASLAILFPDSGVLHQVQYFSKIITNLFFTKYLLKCFVEFIFPAKHEKYQRHNFFCAVVHPAGYSFYVPLGMLVLP